MTGSAPSYCELLRGRVPTPVAERLARYGELVERWSATHNLVRFASRENFVERHLMESLAGREALGAGGALADVGSGAGLPGVPLLAACEGWRGVLIEPRAKRWAFLRLVIRELELDAVALRCRYQELPPGVGPFDAVTLRAVGGVAEVLTWARGHLTERGSVVLWTTEDELAGLERCSGWRVVSSALPCLQRGRLARFQQCFT